MKGTEHMASLYTHSAASSLLRSTVCTVFISIHDKQTITSNTTTVALQHNNLSEGDFSLGHFKRKVNIEERQQRLLPN